MEKRILWERTHYYAPNINIVLTGLVQGIGDCEAVRTAILTACGRYEIFHCKVVQQEDGEACFQKTEVERPPQVTILPDGSADWISLMYENSRIPFAFHEGELIRFFLFPGENQVRILVIAHHLCGDGLSVAYLLQEILETLSGKADTEESPLVLPDDSLIPRRAKLKMSLSMMIRMVNEQWKKTGYVFSYEDYEKMFRAYWEKHRPALYTSILPEGMLKKAAEKAKEEKVSVNSALMCAFMLAAQKNGEEPAGVSIAVNVRPEGYKGLGNYASGVSSAYQPEEELSFWENARRTHQAVYAKLNNPSKKFFIIQFMNALTPTLVDAAYFSAFGEVDHPLAQKARDMFGYGQVSTKLSLTNLTKDVIPRQYGSYFLRSLQFVPPLVPNTKYIIGAVTLGDEASLTLQEDALRQDVHGEAILKDAVGILKAALA